MVDQNPQTNPGSSSSSGLDPNLASLLCYVCGFITGIVFLLIEKNNRTVRFHAWHSILFGVATFILSIVLSVLSTIILNISFWLYSAFSVIYIVVWLGILVIWILLMVKAYQGTTLTLPVITDAARKQADK